MHMQGLSYGFEPRLVDHLILLQKYPNNKEFVYPESEKFPIGTEGAAGDSLRSIRWADDKRLVLQTINARYPNLVKQMAPTLARSLGANWALLLEKDQQAA